MAVAPAPNYLFDVTSKPPLPLYNVPLVEATHESVDPFGCLVSDPKDFSIEIVRWPAQGWRLVDEDSGNEGGYTEGIFHGKWKGDVLYGVNEAVKGNYVLGWSTKEPCLAKTACTETPNKRERVILWHLNYHPDGGQMFYPLDKKPFVVPVALPGDDLTLESIVGLWCDGSKGLYINPGVWHEGVFPVDNEQRFHDRQGKVHARISCDLAKEFKVYLSVPLHL